MPQAPATTPKRYTDVGRCAHCAEPVRRRTDDAGGGALECNLPKRWPGPAHTPTVYTGPAQLVDLGYLNADGTPTELGAGARAASASTSSTPTEAADL